MMGPTLTLPLPALQNEQLSSVPPFASGVGTCSDDLEHITQWIEEYLENI